MKNNLDNKKDNINIFKDSLEGSKYLSKVFIKNIKSCIQKKGFCSIGLPTGKSPINLYSELVNSYKMDKICFKNVVFFNLDEFYPIGNKDENSYQSYMYKHLINQVNFEDGNLNFLDGETKNKKLEHFCKIYEKKIDDINGIDIQILGIGKNGHIGFNEPGSKIDSITRKVRISNSSYNIISEDFESNQKIPKEAITIGIKTILSAKKIFLIAWGKNKSSIIKKAIKREISDSCPASFLKLHKDVTYFLDEKSASALDI